MKCLGRRNLARIGRVLSNTARLDVATTCERMERTWFKRPSLAERTEEHSALFEEGCEAAYFSSTEELIEKVKYYLEKVSLRKAIALNGFRKASNVPYTYDAQLERILEQL
jgi:spore maturation protein CgeB